MEMIQKELYKKEEKKVKNKEELKKNLFNENIQIINIKYEYNTNKRIELVLLVLEKKLMMNLLK